MIYPGQVWSLPDEQAAELKAVDDLVVEAIELLAKHGLEGLQQERMLDYGLKKN